MSQRTMARCPEMKFSERHEGVTVYVLEIDNIDRAIYIRRNAK